MPGGQGDPSPTQELHTQAHKGTHTLTGTHTHTHIGPHTGTNTGTHTQTHTHTQTRAGDPPHTGRKEGPAQPPLPGHSQQAGGCKE